MRLFLFALALAVMTADVQGQSARRVSPRQDPLHRQDQFYRLDGNGDGRLTLAEFASHPGAFQAMDCDGDRLLVESEYIVPYRCSEQAASPEPFTPGGRNPGEAAGSGGSYAAAESNGHGKGGMSLHGYPPVTDSEMVFDDLDRNADGRLTISEWTSSHDDFMRLDANRDGALTRSELGNTPRPPARGFGRRG